MFASVGCAYVLWFFFGLFGAHRFYVGRPVSGFVWLFTLGLFGIGWIIDVFLIPEFVEEHNKRVFHQQMLETGNNFLFDGGDYGGNAGSPFYPPQNTLPGSVPAYSQHVYLSSQGATGRGQYDSGYY